MRIAQVTATFPPYMAGTGNVCYHISLELAKLGHDVTVYTSRFPDVEYDYPDTINVMRFRPVLKIESAPFILQLLKLKGFDVIHLHYPYYFGGEMVYIASKLLKQKYVLTYHNDVIGTGIGSNILRLIFELHKISLFKLVLTNANKIIVPSIDFARNSNLAILKEFDHSIIEIPNGVDTNRFYPEVDCKEIKNKYGLWGKQVILFVRALDKAHYHCGLEYLLNSIIQLDNKNAVLLVVGDGDLRDHYLTQSAKLGISDKVIFAGNIPNEHLPKYYAASDIFVLPSTETENFPLVLLEALSCARPAITSNLPGVRKLIRNNIDGLLVKPKDVDDLALKIQYLLDNEDVRTKLGASGREKVIKSCSWGMIAKRLEKMYETIIE
jgi:glycosyltransferase involved in cell wall biosynthesis